MQGPSTMGIPEEQGLQPNPQQQQQMYSQQYQQQPNLSQDPSQQRPPQQPQNIQMYTLYIGDLSREVTERDLDELFSAYGKVNIKLVKDNESQISKGYAFANFNDPNEADRAMKELNYIEVKGRCIRIMLNQKDSSLRKSGVGNIFIKNLDKNVTSRILYEKFCTFGKIVSCKVATDDQGVSKGFGFVQYTTKEEADLAIQESEQMQLFESKIYVGQFKQSNLRQGSSESFNNLYIRNLPENFDDIKLTNLFSQYGEILSYKIMKDSQNRPFAFVCYVKPEDAKNARDALKDSDYEQKQLYVEKFMSKQERQKHIEKIFQENKKKLAEKTRGCNLYIKNLEDKLTERDLVQLFQTFGEITSCKIMTEQQYVSKDGRIESIPKSKGFGFICFRNPEDAQKAKEKMNNQHVNDKPLYINFAESKDSRKQNLMNRFQQKGINPQFHQQCFICMQQRMGPNQMFMYPQMMPYPMFNPYMYGRPMPPNMRMPLQRQMWPQGQQRQQMNMPQQRVNTLGYRTLVQQQRGQGQFRKQQRGNQMQQQQQQEGIQIDLSELEGKTEQDQKQILGERLYQYIFKIQPTMSGKITGMLLEMENEVIIQLLRNTNALNMKIQEAIQVLEQYEKENQTQKQ